jgi:carbon-monoxide dehydrogenase large subunit
MDETTRLDDTHYRFIGKPIPRHEDARLVTGHGRFSADFKLDGEACAAMVRPPHPHAHIRGIDSAAAHNGSQLRVE